MPNLGAPELVIIFAIVLVLFGAGRLAELGKSLGQGIREFRRATSEDEPEASAARREEPEARHPGPRSPRACPACGSAQPAEHRFCSDCGASLAASTGPKG